MTVKTFKLFINNLDDPQFGWGIQVEILSTKYNKVSQGRQANFSLASAPLPTLRSPKL